MANTYTQLYIQFIFSVKGRQNLVHESIREELEKVICSIVIHQNCKPLAIFCNPDHTHLFVSMNPTISFSKLMEMVKSGSSLWLNKNHKLMGRFSWQDGYGAFSYAKSQKENVKNYILTQPQHHKKITFREEFKSFLEKFEVGYDERYLFEFYDDGLSK